MKERLGYCRVPGLRERFSQTSNVSFKIPLVAYQVFPVSTLPDTTLTSPRPARGSPFTGRNSTRKFRVDQSPSCLVVRIAKWHRPNAMQAIGERDNRKRMIALDLAEGVPQHIYMVGQ